MKISHLIKKLETLNPELPVSLELRGFVQVPIGPGDGGEMMYREPQEDARMCASMILHPDDISIIAEQAVLSVNYVLRYEFTDRLEFLADVRPGNRHVINDPQEQDMEDTLDALFGTRSKIRTLVFPLPEANE
jgi:hypothetical protein